MSTRLSTLVLALIALLGMVVAHRSHRVVDELRYQQGAWDTERMRPNGPALRTAAMGYHTMLADFLWLRTVLVAAEVYDDPQPEKIAWLRESLLAISVLDPEWRTLYFYGGGFLRVIEDIEGSNLIFELGHEALPEDPYFPFSRGMNSYLYPDAQDHEASMLEAAEWIERAAELPGTPGWYKGTAAVFRSEAGSGQREVAIEYLEQQLELETRPVARATFERRLVILRHDQIAELLEQARVGYEARFKVPLDDLNLLVDQGKELPLDPRGGEWVIGADGAIRSSILEEEHAERARRIEREFLTHTARKARKTEP